ncbi:hypothetical protein MBLNU230_g7116t1 [Neophaeotheca triangularis]
MDTITASPAAVGETFFVNDTKPMNWTVSPASRNNTIPWDDEEALQQRFQQWAKLQNLPPWSSMFTFFAWVAFVIITTGLSYTLWDVTATLAISEAPEPTLRSQEKRDDDEVLSIPPTNPAYTYPTTSSLRKTLRHLLNQAGLSSLFRGAAATIFTTLATGLLHIPLYPLLPNDAAHPDPSAPKEPHPYLDFFMNFYTLLPILLLTHWSTAQTHIILSAPSYRVWYRRLPPFLPTLLATWRPLVLHFFASYLTFNVPRLLHEYFALASPAKLNALDPAMAAHAAIWLCAQSSRLLLLVPAGIILTRVQASLLPEDEDAIVPLDRSFGAGSGNSSSAPGGGYVPPRGRQGILAPERGALGLREAWAGVDGREYRRVLWFYGKLMLVEVGVRVAFWPVLGEEVWPRPYWNPSA